MCSPLVAFPIEMCFEKMYWRAEEIYKGITIFTLQSCPNLLTLAKENCNNKKKNWKFDLDLVQTSRFIILQCYNKFWWKLARSKIMTVSNLVPTFNRDKAAARLNHQSHNQVHKMKTEKKTHKKWWLKHSWQIKSMNSKLKKEGKVSWAKNWKTGPPVYMEMKLTFIYSNCAHRAWPTSKS